MPPDDPLRQEIIAEKIIRCALRDTQAIARGLVDTMDEAEFLSTRVRARLLRATQILADAESSWAGRA